MPIAVAPVAAGGVSALAGATSGLAAAQSNLVSSSAEVAGAQNAVAASTQKSTAALLGAGTATARLDAGLLGLRTALGSTAVIGLGALALAAIVAGKAISASIKNFAAFQQELSTFRVVAGASADEMKRVSEQATRLGADVRLPAVSAADAAIAMTELAKAGLSVEDALAGAEGVLQLATAAQISNAEAALIAANALNSFGLAGDQATVVADGFANAANAAQGSIADMGLAFRQASAVARQVGLSLQDTQAILSLFAKNGLQGSDAGTSLRVALIKLVAPTDKAAKVIKELGLQIRDAQGNVRADVFAQFGEATRNLTPAFRDAAAAAIFGQDAIRAVSIGAREGAEGLRIMQFEIDQQGTAAEVAAARTEGLGGSFSALKSGAETLSISFGKLLGLGIKPYVDIAATVVTVTNKIADSFDNLATAALNVETPLGRVKDRLFDIASVGIPIIGEARLIRAGLDKVGVGGDENAKKIKELNEELQSLQTARIEAERGAAGPSPIADELTKQIKDLRAEIKGLEAEGKGIDTNLTTPLQRAVAELEKVRKSRGPNVDTSGLDRMIAKLREQITTAQETARENNRLTRDIGFLGSSATVAAGGVDVLTAALTRLNRESSTLSDQLQKAQAEGASPQAQIALLQEQNATQRAKIANAESGGRTSGDISKIREARAEIISNNAQIESLQNEITASTQALATSAEKAQKERQDAFERILAAQLRPKERLLSRASVNEGLADDIKFREIIINILKRQIVLIRKTLGDTTAARELVKGIQDRILAEAAKLKQDRQNFRKQLRDALKARLDRIRTGVELDVELADINENTKKRISLREKLIQQLKKEQKKLKLTGNALKENRNEIARINAEIKAIKEETGKTGKAFGELAFQFLQTQQGFAANLLGNLIPGGATGGLVGGSAAQGLSAPQFTPGTGVEKESAIASGRDRGIGVQGDTMIHVLRDIKRLLMNLNGRAGHPEARHQKATSGSAMDVM